MKCIYSVFYKKLKSYDGRDSNSDLRLRLFKKCIESYKKCNPDINIIIEYVDEEIENTALMYFDKMTRIKNLNKSFDVLWVDADTICLENISEIFDQKMKGVFWGCWDSLNVLNGGVIFYPKRYLYDNWDIFSKDWINLLTKIIDEDKKFIGHHEQFPIVNLFLKQFNQNCESYDLYSNLEKLKSENYLLDWSYNYNPILNDKMENYTTYDSRCNTILNKKIIHLNMSSDVNIDVEHLYNYVIDNLIGYTNDKNILYNRCKELGISSEFLKINHTNKNFYIHNSTLSFIKVFLFEDDSFDLRTSMHYILSPGWCANVDLIPKWKKILVKNILSGEERIFL